MSRRRITSGSCRPWRGVDSAKLITCHTLYVSTIGQPRGGVSSGSPRCPSFCLGIASLRPLLPVMIHFSGDSRCTALSRPLRGRTRRQRCSLSRPREGLLWRLGQTRMTECCRKAFESDMSHSSCGRQGSCRVRVPLTPLQRSPSLSASASAPDRPADLCRPLEE